MGNIHTVGPNEALIVSGKFLKSSVYLYDIKNYSLKLKQFTKTLSENFGTNHKNHNAIMDIYKAKHHRTGNV